MPKGTKLVRRTDNKPGMVVKAKTTVKVHAIFQGYPAMYCSDGEFLYPKPATISWAGSGGYWKEVLACDVTPVRFKGPDA